MAGISQSSNVKSSYKEGQNYTVPLIVLTNLFFIWAFVTNLNDILIPYLKKACNLTDFESSLVQSAFFGAYFLMSLPAGFIIKKLGYKKGILLGLFMMMMGAFLFIPAAISHIYLLFLGALFILASGVTLLQVAANPYVAILGPPSTASSRLNLTQAFNSLGATLGPLIGGAIILKGAQEVQDGSSVILTYVGIAAIIVVIGVIIFLTRLPEIEQDEDTSNEGVSNQGSLFDHKHLVYGVISIFLYVGAEVAIGSFIIRYAGMPEIANLDEHAASTFVGAYMFMAMIGRFLGSYLLSKINPSKALAFNSFAAIALIIASIFTTGTFALYTIVAVGLCNSIMFPTIFTLAIKDLGSYTKKGSSLLIMAIVGGAIIPPVMGKYSDMNGIQNAFVVPALCYIFVLFYGLKGYKPAAVPKLRDSKDSKAIKEEVVTA